MRYEELFENFYAAVQKAITQKTKVASTLASILKLEKEAVYRRIRKDVPFTFEEIATVAGRLGFSLDEVIALNPSSRSSNMRFVEYINPEDAADQLGLAPLQNLFKEMRAGGGEAKACYSCNSLPLPLYLGYGAITRFQLFKWNAMSAPLGSVKRFGEITTPSQILQVGQQILEDVRQFESTYIIDNTLFSNLVNDIRYFASIRMITPAEVQELKKELLKLINDLESLATVGRYPDGPGRVNVYIASINFESCHSSFEAPDMKAVVLKSFQFNAVATREGAAVERIQKWIQSLKRVSTLVSQSGEQQRVFFFNQQREMVGSL